MLWISLAGRGDECRPSRDQHCGWKAPAQDKAGNTGSSAPGLWQEAIQPDSSGAEFGAQGCEATPQEERTLGREAPVISLPTADKHWLWPQLPT